MAPRGWETVEAGGLRFRVRVHPCVYPPSEDTLLAIRLLESLRGRWGRLGLAADLGSGTGALGLAASLIYGSWVVATDINPWAVEATRETLGGRGVALRCHWASCLGPGFDLAIANPPYLPVEDRLGECGGWLERAWSGGPGAVEEACLEASRVADRVVIVYSSLTGWDPGECLARRGMRLVAKLSEHYFMEEIVAVAGERVG